MASDAHPPITAAASTDERAAIASAASSALIRLAVDYNDALDRCTQPAAPISMNSWTSSQKRRRGRS